MTVAILNAILIFVGFALGVMCMALLRRYGRRGKRLMRRIEIRERLAFDRGFDAGLNMVSPVELIGRKGPSSVMPLPFPRRDRGGA